MAERKASKKFEWKKGDLVVEQKVYKGKPVDKYPWEDDPNYFKKAKKDKK